MARSFLSVVIIACVYAIKPSAAVCASGQMAVGYDTIEEFTGPSREFNEYSGFLMANDCGIIAQNGITQDSNQVCNGGYSGGASVSCSGTQNPTSAVDTEGQHWSCSHTSDSSCNSGGSASLQVIACCNRD